MREQSALINVEAALSSVPKKGMFFESKIITVNRTDVEQIQGIANTQYVHFMRDFFSFYIVSLSAVFIE